MPTSKPKAIGYAEDVLGVHTTYAEARSVIAQLREAYEELTLAKAERRTLVLSAQEYETEVVEEVYRTSSDASVSAIERSIKRVIANDDFLIRNREEQSSMTSRVDAAEHRVRVLTAESQVLAARINEIGGYLNFLAAAKLAHANTASQTSQSSQES